MSEQLLISFELDYPTCEIEEQNPYVSVLEVNAVTTEIEVDIEQPVV